MPPQSRFVIDSSVVAAAPLNTGETTSAINFLEQCKEQHLPLYTLPLLIAEVTNAIVASPNPLEIKRVLLKALCAIESSGLFEIINPDLDLLYSTLQIAEHLRPGKATFRHTMPRFMLWPSEWIAIW